MMHTFKGSGSSRSFWLPLRAAAPVGLLLLGCTAALAQERYFARRYHGLNASRIHPVANGLVVSGDYIFPQDAIVRTDISRLAPDGAVQWDYRYDNVEIKDVAPGSDGNVFVGWLTTAGNITTGGVSLKTDSNGNEVWRRQYNTFYPSRVLRVNIPCSVFATGPGSCTSAFPMHAVAGWLFDPAVDNGRDRLGIALISSGGTAATAGRIVWQREIQQLPLSASIVDFQPLVEETQSGAVVAGYVILAFASYGGPPWEPGDWWVIRLDVFGHLLWNKVYGSPPNAPQGGGTEVPYAIRPTRDRGFVIVGSAYAFVDDYPQQGGNPNDTDVWVVKTDGHGDIVWEQLYRTSHLEGGRDIAQTGDGGYIIAGISSPDGYAADALVIKTDPSGAIEWQIKFNPGTGFSQDWAGSVSILNDGYLIGGSWNGPTNERGLFVLKLKASGTIANCPLLQNGDVRAVSSYARVSSLSPSMLAVTPIPAITSTIQRWPVTDVTYETLCSDGSAGEPMPAPPLFPWCIRVGWRIPGFERYRPFLSCYWPLVIVIVVVVGVVVVSGYRTYRTRIV